MRRLLTGRSERALLGAAVLVVLATLGTLVMQQVGVPSSMRYVPPHSTAYVVSAPLRDLWAGLSPHLQGYFEAPPNEDATPAQTLARSLAQALDERGIVLRRAEDLAELGIDAGGQAVMALVDHDGGEHALLALPVSDPVRFAKTVERYTGGPLVVQADAGKRRLYQSQSGGVVLGFGDDGAALISDAAALVQAVLAAQKDNLAYFQSSDWHRRGLSARVSDRDADFPAWLRGRLNTPALAALTGGNEAAALFGDLQFAVAANERSLELQVHGPLPDGRAEVIARLLAPPPARGGTATAVLSRSQAAVSLGDHSLSYFLRYLPADTPSGPLAGFQRLFPGLLDELRGVNSLSELSLAASDPLARVPGMVAGLRIAKTEADAMVVRLQSSLRLKRDREILRLAADEYRSQASLDAGTPVTVQTLRVHGLLGQQNDALWLRYALANDRAVPKPALAGRDFDNPSYVRPGKAGIVFRYLMPPVTDDDLSYRFSDKRDQIDAAELKQNKYRLCSAYRDGTLWLGNDAEVLAGWLARLGAMPVSNDYAAAMDGREAPAQAKLNVLLLPRQLLESSQLYPDDKVNKTMHELLVDVRQYRSAQLVITPIETEREIHVLARFDRN
jgi:hypothetical protein